jgi:hypothetical protein
VAVTGGFRSVNGTDFPLYDDLSGVPSDPIGELLAKGWLCSGNHLFKSAEIPSDFFDVQVANAEWTWLAFRLAIAGKVITSDNAAGVRYYDSPNSLSKSIKHQEAYVELFGRMLNERGAEAYRSRIRRRLSRSEHDYADALLHAGRISEAVRMHLRSVSNPGGLRYLSFSRHLLAAWLQRSLAGEN